LSKINQNPLKNVENKFIIDIGVCFF